MIWNSIKRDRNNIHYTSYSKKDEYNTDTLSELSTDTRISTAPHIGKMSYTTSAETTITLPEGTSTTSFTYYTFSFETLTATTGSKTYSWEEGGSTETGTTTVSSTVRYSYYNSYKSSGKVLTETAFHLYDTTLATFYTTYMVRDNYVTSSKIVPDYVSTYSLGYNVYNESSTSYNSFEALSFGIWLDRPRNSASQLQITFINYNNNIISRAFKSQSMEALFNPIIGEEIAPIEDGVAQTTRRNYFFTDEGILYQMGEIFSVRNTDIKYSVISFDPKTDDPTPVTDSSMEWTLNWPTGNYCTVRYYNYSDGLRIYMGNSWGLITFGTYGASFVLPRIHDVIGISYEGLVTSREIKSQSFGPEAFFISGRYMSNGKEVDIRDSAPEYALLTVSMYYGDNQMTYPPMISSTTMTGRMTDIGGKTYQIIKYTTQEVYN